MSCRRSWHRLSRPSETVMSGRCRRWAAVLQQYNLRALIRCLFAFIGVRPHQIVFSGALLPSSYSGMRCGSRNQNRLCKYFLVVEYYRQKAARTIFVNFECAAMWSLHRKGGCITTVFCSRDLLVLEETVKLCRALVGSNVGALLLVGDQYYLGYCPQAPCPTQGPQRWAAGHRESSSQRMISEIRRAIPRK